MIVDGRDVAAVILAAETTSERFAMVDAVHH